MGQPLHRIGIMRSQVALRLDEPDIVEFEVKANGRVYKFQGRIDQFNLEAQRDDWFDVDVLNRPMITRPVTTFEIHGTVVGELRAEEPRTPEQEYSSFPQRYALGMDSSVSAAVLQAGRHMAEGLVQGLKTCYHMCSCTTECLFDCSAMCGD